MEERKKRGWKVECETDNGKIRGTKEVPMLCLCCFHLVGVVQIGNNGEVRRKVEGGEEVGCDSNSRVGEGREQWEQLVVGRAVSWQEFKCGILKTKKEGGRREKRKEKKEVKNKVSIHKENVVLQTVELAKLKCTFTMGTLGEKEEKKD